jgi:hypothetical protein
MHDYAYEVSNSSVEIDLISSDSREDYCCTSYETKSFSSILL